MRDDFIIRIIDKSLFVSEDGLMELPDEQCEIIISFPRQFPKGVDPEEVENTAQ